MKYDFKDKYVWITGGSTGIGYELVKSLLAKGAYVLACARNTANLDALQADFGKQLSIAQLDVSNYSEVKNFSKQIINFNYYLDVILLNAGQCHYIDLPTFDSQLIKKNFAVNFFGMTYCIELALPFIRKSKSPYIVGMASSVAFVALPRAEGYGASKAAIHYLLQTLQVDLYKEQIPVSIIAPGFVDTPLTAKNNFAMPWLVSSEKAAKIIITGLEKQKLQINFPKKLVWLFRLISLIPDKIRIKLLANKVSRT